MYTVLGEFGSLQFIVWEFMVFSLLLYSSGFRASDLIWFLSFGSWCFEGMRYQAAESRLLIADSFFPDFVYNSIKPICVVFQVHGYL